MTESASETRGATLDETPKHFARCKVCGMTYSEEDATADSGKTFYSCGECNGALEKIPKSEQF